MQMQVDTYSSLKSTVQNKIDDINFFLAKSFKNNFEKNDKGVPNDWKSMKPE